MNLQPNSIVLKKVLDFSDIKIEHVDSSLKLTTSQIQAIEGNWQKIISESKLKGIKVWDAVTYRFESINTSKNIISLSTVNYRTRRGLEKINYKILPSSLQPNSQGLFIASLIQTNDGDYILGNKKTIDKSEFANIELIGGICSPEEVIINSGKDLETVILKEIEEEIGVSRNFVNNTSILGITIGKHTNVGVISNTQLNLSNQELLDLFHAKSDEEIESLIFVNKTKLIEILKQHPSYPSLIPQLLS